MNTRLYEILSYVPEDIRKILENTFRISGDSILEIRFRVNRPLIVSLLSGNFAVLPGGSLSPAVGGAYIVKTSDVRGIFQLICENSIVEEILDRFGNGAKVSKSEDEEHFKVKVKAVVSEGLASWVMQYGNKIEIREPVLLRNMVKEKAEEIAALYKYDIFVEKDG